MSIAPTRLVPSDSTAHADELTQNVDKEVLERDLREAITGEVRFDTASRALYATDASNYRQVPIGVVIPRDEDDVVKAMEICFKHNAPIFGRGAGTSIAGQCCNVAVCFDFSKYMNKILELNAEEGYAWVQPGIILDDLRREAEKHRLTFGPDPATHDRCTMGGMIGNNSCGVHSVMAGRTMDNIEELEILTYDGARMVVGNPSPEELEQIIAEGGRKGEIHAQLKELRDRYSPLVREKFPILPRRVSGFNLEVLLPEYGFHVARTLVGTEGTCVMMLRAKVKLVPSPPKRMLVVLGYPDVYHAADHVMAILKHKPVGLEGMDDYLLNFLRKKQAEKSKGVSSETVSTLGKAISNPVKAKADAGDVLPPGSGWLLVEFGGETYEEALAAARGMMTDVARHPNPPSMKLMEDPNEEKMVWEVRKSGLGATAFLPGNKNTWPGWEDAAVPPERLGEYLRDFDVLRKKFGYECAMYGHFGEGCIHMRIDFDMVTREGVDKFLAFIDEAADLVVKYGGSISGEHGDGHARAHLLPKMFGDELVHAFRLFKGIWDPTNRMNPGKLVDPYPPDEFLRLGPGYESWRGETMFSYPESDHSMGRAVLRCVGVGRCRRLDTGTMCPSFMATRDEKNSTRGRAHLLQEMFNGEVVKDMWKSEEVKESLDLCLACKGCKSDCPVNVDMATYKSEFLFHYYKGKFRPMKSYTMGWIRWWAQIAQVAPGFVNMFTQNKVIGGIMKKMSGIAMERPIPKFAPQTFRQWLAERGDQPVPENSRGRVILWADTFNNHFTPATSRDALEVLENIGFEVVVPKKMLCCGRPLYDHGFLGMAKKLLEEILIELRSEILAGTPIVGLEPSCIAVFRDELVNLFNDDPVAHQLSRQVYTVAEFIDQYAPDWEPEQMQGNVLFHGHCHQKSVLTIKPDQELLKRSGLKVDAPDSGCCGMAGAFGFDEENYDVSVQVGERVLLPAARAADDETFIVTDGFSCREQVEQLTGKKPLHLVQVLRRIQKKAENDRNKN